ncbi:hypothetical protein ACTFIR_000999 [Dictyostelium discoideum]
MTPYSLRISRKDLVGEDNDDIQDISTVPETKINQFLTTCCNNKTYCISGILCKGPNSKVTDIIDGTTIFLEYYQKKYPRYKIADLTQPLLKSEVKMKSKNYNISNFVNELILTQQFLKSWGNGGISYQPVLKVDGVVLQALKNVLIDLQQKLIQSII